MATVEAGKTYKVNHSRKGTFDLKVERIAGEWITGTILSGRARFIALQNDDLVAGDEITVGLHMATWEEVA